MLYLSWIPIFLFACTHFNVVEQYENGSKKLECEISDGLKNGKCIGYFPNGEIKFVANYKSDSLDGKSQFFHKNGGLHWEVEFQNGVKNGEITYYDEDGNIFQKSNFKNNKLDGLSYSYFPAGSLKSKMGYLNDELHGAYYSYFENGSVQTEATYEQNQIIDFYHYDSAGKLIDHFIKYELGQENNQVMVKALNKHFSAFGLRVDVIENASSKKILYDKISADGHFSFAVPPRYTGDTLIFQLYEIDSLENDPLNGVVRSKVEFEYEMQ